MFYKSQTNSNSYVNVSKLPSLFPSNIFGRFFYIFFMGKFLVVVENKFDSDNSSIILTFSICHHTSFYSNYSLFNLFIQAVDFVSKYWHSHILIRIFFFPNFDIDTDKFFMLIWVSFQFLLRNFGTWELTIFLYSSSVVENMMEIVNKIQPTTVISLVQK